MPGASAGVAIIGGGVAGGLLALALRDQGAKVSVLDAAPADGSSSATAISYGALPGWPLAPTPLARLAATASQHWRELERRHGPLGWQRCSLRLQGPNPALALAARLGALPFAQVDSAQFSTRLPLVLAAAGVERRSLQVQALGPLEGGWQLQLSDGSRCTADHVVLAAGAHCRALWPGLPERLRRSWATVLELARCPEVLGPATALLPQGFARVGLERRAAALSQPAWVVDPGLVPWGATALVGQHTWIAPAAMSQAAPSPSLCAAELRQGLVSRPQWPVEGAVVRQAAVAFCSSGAPLVGPVAAAPGLWVFSGFSAAFSQVPVLAPWLAQRIAAPAGPAAAAQRRLQQLGVWPEGG